MTAMAALREMRGFLEAMVESASNTDQRSAYLYVAGNLDRLMAQVDEEKKGE